MVAEEFLTFENLPSSKDCNIRVYKFLKIEVVRICRGTAVVCCLNHARVKNSPYSEDPDLAHEIPQVSAVVDTGSIGLDVNSIRNEFLTRCTDRGICG